VGVAEFHILTWLFFILTKLLPELSTWQLASQQQLTAHSFF